MVSCDVGIVEAASSVMRVVWYMSVIYFWVVLRLCIYSEQLEVLIRTFWLSCYWCLKL